MLATCNKFIIVVVKMFYFTEESLQKIVKISCSRGERICLAGHLVYGQLTKYTSIMWKKKVLLLKQNL